MVELNKVTWYSQFLAIILGVSIFFLGFYLGRMSHVDNQVTNLKTEDKSVDISVSFKELKSDESYLPPVPSLNEWNLVLEKSGIFQDRIEEGVARYGDLAKRFYSQNEYEGYYIDVVYADVTADGISESIISFDGGGTYGIIKYAIVSGDKIIATIEPRSVGRSGGFQPDMSGNGFSMIWYTEDMFPDGYCCPVAMMVTRFDFVNNRFVAMEEKLVEGSF